MRRYYERYCQYGFDSLGAKKRNKRYSKAFKEQLVQAYLNGHGSLMSLSALYNIPNHTTLSDWILRYTSGKEAKGSLPKPEVYTMKARKTTVEERVKITEECIQEGFTYKETAEKHQVTYGQIYQWVKKYKDHGPEALQDGRGKGKASGVQSDQEKLEAKIKALEARNQWLEMENDVLKKANEIEEEMIRNASAK
ncbi:helix-turn-helix domain-containing protein, partial [Bacillus sp. JCM 19041]|uniref:helix-turn-helix domain-containing protein n=1 Tax=Bacillus sp. JCM 19041 TaxID=1460637 RepID=UPI00336AB814